MCYSYEGVAEYHLVVARYPEATQKLSRATWIQELVAQLGYQPKVQNDDNKFVFVTKIESHEPCLNLSQ